ncbi:hypothetical protein [Mycobacterium sp. E2327]|uniref:hypothetical protein n=1 Tax=Mycobacterium sp. E2327 TaxID=1834132 RepID=UPI0009ECFBDF|nr:hypothetical protein [Mycobacterium sp. E2327]
MNLRGIELRYVLAMHLAHNGRATVAEMLHALEAQGFCVPGRASKVISDALRWETERDRVRRLRRGLYGPGYIPRSTEHRMHVRVLALRAAAKCRSEAGTKGAPSARVLMGRM